MYTGTGWGQTLVRDTKARSSIKHPLSSRLDRRTWHEGMVSEQGEGGIQYTQAGELHILNALN